MVRRQAVVTLAENSNLDNELNRYCVRYRERGWIMWRPWLSVIEDVSKHYYWDYKTARLIADQAMANGVVTSVSYTGYCNVIVELDEE